MEQTEKKDGLSPAEKKLAEIRTKRAALVESTKARDAAREVEDALEREERELANEEAIAAAENEHGRIRDGKLAAVATRLGVVIVKRPKSLFFKRFMEGKDTRADAEKLIAHCLVHPSQHEFDEILEELPATLDVVVNVCTQLAGITAKEVSGK